MTTANAAESPRPQVDDFDSGPDWNLPNTPQSLFGSPGPTFNTTNQDAITSDTNETKIGLLHRLKTLRLTWAKSAYEKTNETVETVDAAAMYLPTSKHDSKTEDNTLCLWTDADEVFDAVIGVLLNADPMSILGDTINVL
jgi:hypothetical protein